MNQVLNSLKMNSNRIAVRGQHFSDVFRSVGNKSIEVPESMDSIFKEASERYHVPLNLLKAVAKAESNFDEKAVSSAGAQGVMQLMPATARALGVEDPFDARSNIMGGAKYLSEKLEQYHGDIDLTLASYNAGSGNVSKYGGVPPFPETRNYIKKIREYMGMDLSACKNVQTGNKATPEFTLSGGMPGTELGNALYMIEVMKLKIQNQLNGVIE